MNFWATRLGTGAPVQQPPAVVAPSTRPWWANDYTEHLRQQPVQPQPPQQQQQYAPEPENEGWGTVKGSMAKAKSARLSETCPECDSTNYFRPTGMPNGMLQCYDCGYNPRFTQTGGQGGLPSGDAGPAQPARQLATAGAGGVSQFNPANIVGHI